ncbi:unnamed protein product, partial [Adineta steineri]
MTIAAAQSTTQLTITLPTAAGTTRSTTSVPQP